MPTLTLLAHVSTELHAHTDTRLAHPPGTGAGGVVLLFQKSRMTRFNTNGKHYGR